MKDVAIVSFAQWSAREEPTRNEVEMLIPVVAQAIDDSGVGRKEIGFTCSGSCDYLAGAPFAFVMGLDAVGAWPPIRESHVEMDGAWALYEAWVRLQHGDVDTALVYSFGKSSLGDLPIVLSQQMDPYYVAPLWPDSVSIAALQARAWLDAGHDEGEMAAVAARSRRFAQDNQWAQVTSRARSPTAPPPSCSPSATGRARCRTTRCGSVASSTSSRRTASACATSRSRRRPRRRERRRA